MHKLKNIEKSIMLDPSYFTHNKKQLLLDICFFDYEKVYACLFFCLEANFQRINLK